MMKNKFEGGILAVNRGEFAYLDQDLEEEIGYFALETANFNSYSYVLGLIDSETGSVALIHSTRANVGEITTGFQKIRKLTDANFDQAVIIYGERSKDKLGFLSSFVGKRVENVKIVGSDRVWSLGVDDGGFYFPTNPKTINLGRVEFKNLGRIKYSLDGVEIE